MAHFSGDPVMLEAFNSGEDIYAQASETVLGQRYEKGAPERYLIKTCYLAMGYGAKPWRIQARLAEDGFRFPLPVIKRAYEGITDLYSVFWEWKDEAIAEAEDTGYVTTIGGHRRHITFNDDTRWKSERQAVNSKIQGSAADIVQATMVVIHRDLPQLDLLLQVHDELLMEADEGLTYDPAVARACLYAVQWKAEYGHGFELAVPLVFEPKFVATWAGGKG